MSFISRGFRGRPRAEASAGRLPPGQYLVNDFPVLSAGPTPRIALSDWTFSITGEIDKPKHWTWDEFRTLPSETITRDIHCVTKWSKLDTAWRGVSVDTLLDGVETVRRVRDGLFVRRLHHQPAARRTSPAGRPGSSSNSMVRRSSPSTAGPRGSSYRTCISGRARSGCADCN